MSTASDPSAAETSPAAGVSGCLGAAVNAVRLFTCTVMFHSPEKGFRPRHWGGKLRLGVMGVLAHGPAAGSSPDEPSES